MPGNGLFIPGLQLQSFFKQGYGSLKIVVPIFPHVWDGAGMVGTNDWCITHSHRSIKG